MIHALLVVAGMAFAHVTVQEGHVVTLYREACSLPLVDAHARAKVELTAADGTLHARGCWRMMNNLPAVHIQWEDGDRDTVLKHKFSPGPKPPAL